MKLFDRLGLVSHKFLTRVIREDQTAHVRMNIRISDLERATKDLNEDVRDLLVRQQSIDTTLKMVALRLVKMDLEALDEKTK